MKEQNKFNLTHKGKGIFVVIRKDQAEFVDKINFSRWIRDKIDEAWLPEKKRVEAIQKACETMLVHLND